MRTDDEVRLLKHEAERRAREGWSRPDISRALGVPVSTLARWALEGCWRDKDIALERMPERLAALNERIARRGGESPMRAPMEYKSSPYAGPPPGYFADDEDFPESEPQFQPEPGGRPDTQYPSGDPGYGPWEPTEKLPKFLTRGGDPNERVCWAAPQLWARTPPWAPGNEVEEPELASLWLAEDLMRQGLLVEAERALRWTKNWLSISRQVFDKQDEEEARHQEYQERREEERAREKARCKALGLPDPDEVLNAQIEQWKAQMTAHAERRKSRDSGDSIGSIGSIDGAGASNAADRSASGLESLPNSLVTAPG